MAIGTNYFKDLPVELKIHTFSFLVNDDQSLDNASLVCKEWNSIIGQNIRQQLDISNSNTVQKIENVKTIHLRFETLPAAMGMEAVPIDCLRALITQNPHLNKIIFSKQEQLDPATLLALPALMPNVKILKGIAAKELSREVFIAYNGFFRNSDIGLPVDDVWKRIAIDMPDLKELDIIAPFEKTTVAQVFQACKKLTAITLYLLGDDRIEDIEAVFKIHGPKISSLTFGNCPYNSMTVNESDMIKILNLFPNLKKLAFQKTFQDYNFPKMDLVEELYMENELNENAFKKMGDAFSHLKKIQLRTPGTNVDTFLKCCKYLPQTLTHFSNSTVYTKWQPYGFKDEECESVANALFGHFPNLQTVILGQPTGNKKHFIRPESSPT